MADRPRLSSVEKGLSILRELAASDGGLAVTELARLTGLNRTTIYRLCDLLDGGGWVQRLGNHAGGDYRERFEIGPTLLGMSVLLTNRYNPDARLRPIIKRLASSLGETVHVGVLDRAHVIHVANALSDSGLHIAARIGAKELAHVTGLGKAMLATLSRAELLELYPKEQLIGRTVHSIRRRRQLFEHLMETERRGYAIDNEESGIGMKCVAVPVFDSAGRAVFALSVTAPPARLSGEGLERAIQGVRAAASLASASFGGRLPDSWSNGGTPSRNRLSVEVG